MTVTSPTPTKVVEGKNIEQIISILGWSILGLVSLITLGSFVLSYNALRQVVLAYGYSPMLSYIWPLLLDASLVVFSLAAVRANVLKENRWLPSLFVLLYASSTVFFNILHAPLEPTEGLINLALASSVPTNILVYAIPPISLLLSFELLMLSLRSIADRSLFFESLRALQKKSQGVAQDMAQKQDDLEGQTSDAEVRLESLWHKVQEREQHLARTEEKIALQLKSSQKMAHLLREERSAKVAALSPTRREVLKLLSSEEQPSMETMAEMSGLSTTTVGFHIRELMDAGLIQSEEEPHER